MARLHRLSGFVLLVQGALWAVLLILFFAVLPRQGFSGLADFNDPAKVASAPFAMGFMVWSDLAFGLTLALNVFVLYRYMRTRTPPLVRLAVTLLLIVVAALFIGHDLGIHLIGWRALAADPASTNYAMDRLLYAFRDGVIFAVGLLTFLATASPKKSG